MYDGDKKRHLSESTGQCSTEWIPRPYIWLTKYYFEDLGIRNALINFRQQEEPHIMENVIYNELCMRGYQVDVGQVNIDDSFKKIVVVKDNIKPWRNEKGILMMGLMDFLVNKNSLEV